jgi:hypothetical protein
LGPERVSNLKCTRKSYIAFESLNSFFPCFLACLSFPLRDNILKRSIWLVAEGGDLFLISASKLAMCCGLYLSWRLSLESLSFRTHLTTRWHLLSKFSYSHFKVVYGNFVHLKRAVDSCIKIWILKASIHEEIYLVKKFNRHDLNMSTDRSIRRGPARGSSQDAQFQVLNPVSHDCNDGCHFWEALSAVRRSNFCKVLLNKDHTMCGKERFTRTRLQSYHAWVQRETAWLNWVVGFIGGDKPWGRERVSGLQLSAITRWNRLTCLAS